MEIRCHCAACGADFGVGGEFAGDNIRCLKCGAEIAVPAVPKSPPPLPLAAGLGSVADGEPSLADIIGLDSPTTTGSQVGSTSRSGPLRFKKRVNHWQGWQIAALAGGGTVAVLGAALAVTWGLSGKSPPPAAPPKPPATLAIELPDDERNGVTMSLDDGNGAQQKELPRSGPVTFTLGAGKYRVSLDRPNYHAEDSVVLKSGGTRSYKPLWVRTSFLPPADYTEPQEAAAGGDAETRGPAEAEKSPLDSWLQDFDQAKQTADREQKSVLVLFDGSDWCGYCQRLTREVFAEPDFAAQVGKDFVLVCIDSPRGGAASAKVQNAARNRRFVQQFGVHGFPTVVLTDAKGRVFGEVVGYKPGGVEAYAAALSHCKTAGEKLLGRWTGSRPRPATRRSGSPPATLCKSCAATTCRSTTPRKSRSGNGWPRAMRRLEKERIPCSGRGQLGLRERAAVGWAEP